MGQERYRQGHAKDSVKSQVYLLTTILLLVMLAALLCAPAPAPASCAGTRSTFRLLHQGAPPVLKITLGATRMEASNIEQDRIPLEAVLVDGLSQGFRFLRRPGPP